MKRQRMIIVRLGEIALKGLNRGKFEQQLMANLKWRLQDLPPCKTWQRESRVYLDFHDADLDYTDVLERIRDVFGFVSASLVEAFPKEIEQLQAQILDYLAAIPNLPEQFSFKFECKRADKAFPIKSYELCCDMGEWVLDHYPGARVDVQNPDYVFHLEIRDLFYLYHTMVPARKGLPVGMSGKGLLLLSGGIDSPVAGYRMASRGMRLEAMYFHTFPYTSEEAKQKVIRLAKILSRYSGQLKLHIVDFTAVQLKLNECSPPEMGTITMRRMMMRIADAYAAEHGLKALITGESLGQVASQTLEALACTDCVVTRPVFRPLIGTDKDETTAIARDIDTFETSILPYEDCCTVFVAKHPKTHPSLDDAERAEAELDIPALVQEGLAGIESLTLNFQD